MYEKREERELIKPGAGNKRLLHRIRRMNHRKRGKKGRRRGRRGKERKK